MRQVDWTRSMWKLLYRGLRYQARRRGTTVNTEQVCNAFRSWVAYLNEAP